MTEEIREFRGSKDVREYELRQFILDNFSVDIFTVELISFNEPERPAQRYETPPPDFSRGGLVIEKVNFEPASGLASITLIQQEREGSRHLDIGAYIQLKTLDGRKYFFETDLTEFRELRPKVFTHPSVKDSFIDTSFLPTSGLGLIEKDFPDYWKELSGYQSTEHTTYEEIHRDMLLQLKEQLKRLPPETKVRLTEIGCGRGELLKKALLDPEINSYISSIGLLDLHSENVELASSEISKVWDGPIQAVAKGMPDGIDDLSVAGEGEYSIVLSSGSLTHRVLTQTQAVETVAKLHEKADKILIGGLTASWINKKNASLLGYAVSQTPKIDVSEITYIDYPRQGNSTPIGPDPEDSTEGVEKTVKSIRVHSTPSSLVTVLSREDRKPQLAKAMLAQYSLFQRESLTRDEVPPAPTPKKTS